MNRLKFIVLLFAALTAASITATPTKAQDESELTEFTSGDIRFVYPADLVTSITQVPIEAYPYNPDEGFPLDYYNPVWTRYDLIGYSLPDRLTLSTFNLFSTADFEDYTLRDGETPIGYGVELENLKALLEERPDLEEYTTTASAELSDDVLTLPYLPFTSLTTQAFRSHAEYFPFDDGWGVRYLVYYPWHDMESGALLPITERDIRYTFQGVSNDGSTYVVANFGIATGLFPLYVEDAPEDETFASDYQTYLDEALAALNALTPDQFNPTLDTLDSIVLSLSINGTIDYDPESSGG